MKPIAADEMFPEGIDIEDVSIQLGRAAFPAMFTSVEIFVVIFQSGNSGIMLDLAASEKDVHVDFYNGKRLRTSSTRGQSLNQISILLDFDDLFDEDDL